MTESPYGAAEPFPWDADHRVMCRQVVELLSDFMERRLSASRHRDVARHLAVCPECAEFAEQLGTTTRLLGELPCPEELPAVLVDSLVAAFRDVIGRPDPPTV